LDDLERRNSPYFAFFADFDFFLLYFFILFLLMQLSCCYDRITHQVLKYSNIIEYPADIKY